MFDEVLTFHFAVFLVFQFLSYVIFSSFIFLFVLYISCHVISNTIHFLNEFEDEIKTKYKTK